MRLLNLLHGQSRMYFSYDDILSDYDNELAQYPIEFFNSLTPSGMPPHRLTLKVGAAVILLRNVNVHEVLCNGTRLQVCHMHDHSIDAEVLTGMKVGYRVLIPRIQLAPSDSGMPLNDHKQGSRTDICKSWIAYGAAMFCTWTIICYIVKGTKIRRCQRLKF